MFKKLLAGASTLVLALAMVAVSATSASAWNNSISVLVSCTDNHQYQAAWSVTNSETELETITASSDPALVAVDTTLGDHETKQFFETFAAPTDKTLTLSTIWTNQETNTNSGSLTENDFPDCTPEHVPVTICHATPPATAANGWNSITIDDDAIVKEGHTGHAADIIPAFSYWEQVDGVWTELFFPGQNLGTDFSGISGSQLLGGGCQWKVTPTAPTFTPAQCTGPGLVGDGSYTIPSQPGVQYSVKIGAGAYNVVAAGTYPAPVGTVIHVKADPLPSWVILLGTTYWNYTVPSPGDCLVLATPVAPTVTVITACGTDGSIVLPSTVGVVYALTVGDGIQGAYTVTATPAFGYHFAGEQQSVEFSGDLGMKTICVTAAASASPEVCTSSGIHSGSISVLVATGVKYYIDGVLVTSPTTSVSAGNHLVTAVADPGYTLTSATSFSVTVLAVNRGTCTQLPTLALTGISSTAPFMGLAGLLALLGGVVLYSRGRRGA
ncbi:MAG: hypothetical protein ABI632_13990 [Pseudolysinimonas sp.]